MYIQENYSEDFMTEITLEELRERLDQEEEIKLVDSRGPGDFAEAHLPGAVNIPSMEVTRLARELLPDRNALIVTYCSGPDCEASPLVAQKLEKLGYTNIREFTGGLEAWQAAELAVEGSKGYRAA